jgi:hypothetical protein
LTIERNVWFGLACLKANPNMKNFRRFDGGKGAYVNVAAAADSRDEFEEKVKRHVEGIGCILVELEKVQLLESRLNQPDYPEELITMRETALRQPDDSVFGTFHIWHQDDSN